MDSLWGQRRGLEFNAESSTSPVNTVTTWWSDGKLLRKEAGLKAQRGSLYFTESRRDQEEGGELDSHEEVRRFCGSRRDQEEGGGAGPTRQPRRDQEQGGGAGLETESWTSFASVVSQRWSNGHCLCDSLLHSGSWDSNCVVR